MFVPPKIVYSMGALFFTLNWVNTIYKYMNNAIVKAELHKDGKTVTITFKGGSEQKLLIKDIIKKRHEKDLVQTFEECYLFPIEVSHGDKKSTYYFYGSGQEPIKNGEVFRAIINGQSIKI